MQKIKQFNPISSENKIVILLLIIFLFGLLILSINKKKSCVCKKKIIYNPYVINGPHEMPLWTINLKKRNQEMFNNI